MEDTFHCSKYVLIYYAEVASAAKKVCSMSQLPPRAQKRKSKTRSITGPNRIEPDEHRWSSYSSIYLSFCFKKRLFQNNHHEKNDTRRQHNIKTMKVGRVRGVGVVGVSFLMSEERRKAISFLVGGPNTDVKCEQ